MSVSNGQIADEDTFNNAFLSRTVDTSTVGRVDLGNLVAASGPVMLNIQRILNSFASFMGATTGMAFDGVPTWTGTYVGSVGDSLKARAEALIARFSGTSGHVHDGTDGEGPKVDATLLAGLTEGAVPFGSGIGGLNEDPTSLFYDPAVPGLGLGNNTPAAMLDLSRDLAIRDVNDASTGAITQLDTDGKGSIRLTGAFTELQGIGQGFDGKIVKVINVSGAERLVMHQDTGASAADRIFIPTLADLKFPDGAIFEFKYDATTQRWRVSGGAGSGGGADWTVVTETTNAVTLTDEKAQRIRLALATPDTVTVDVSAITEDSTEVEFLGTDDDNPATINAASDLLLNGSWVAVRGSIMRARWDDGLAALVEISRNAI